MSTRCQIKISYLHREVILYHHWDGYPKGVGSDLIRRQKGLNTWDGNILVNNLVKDINDEYEIAYQERTQTMQDSFTTALYGTKNYTEEKNRIINELNRNSAQENTSQQNQTPSASKKENFTSAPRRNNSSTRFLCPYKQANIRGVVPWLSVESILCPFLSNA